ncbi:MAG: FtsH protease activity modulator HflK [Halobacteriovoraceae bacterium]|nr:FtsH protease activity modulator HflK [Halobacteriovoraceae bacterium]
MSNPNDFQEEMERFKKQFSGLNSQIPGFGKWGAPIVIILLVLIGALSSFYTVEPDEEAVVLRFGKYTGSPKPPGLHFKLPFGVDRVIKVQTKRVLQEEFGFRTSSINRRASSSYSARNFDLESLMLTGDLNVADVEWVVQYQISDPYNFLFRTSSPIVNIRDVAESIMRRVVGDRTVTEVLTTGRKEIAIVAKELMQEVLNKYELGINVVTVKLQDVNPPDVVKPSFNEVNEAKQEQEKVINQAEKAYNNIIPEARGRADKLVTEAEGYALELINKATGDANRFKLELIEYKRAPLVTKKRLYLESMEKIFKSQEDLVVIDSEVKGMLPIFSNQVTK